MAQLPSQSQFGDYGDWPGRDVLDAGGERLGGVREIYLDRETGRPEWVLVDVDGAEARFVPLADASVESSAIRVAHSASTIRSAPGIGTEPRIDQSEERRLYEHYGIGYSTEESASGLPAEEPPTREHEHPPTGPTPTAWGAPDTGGRTAPDTSAPEDTPSSWSAAAGDEPTNLSPPAAEPPAPEELEEALIPEPPESTDRAIVPDLTPHAAQPEPPVIEPIAPPDVFTAPVVGTPAPAGPPAPAGAAAAPEPESDGGALDTLKSRKVGVATALSIAVILLLIIRRLR